MSFCDTMLCVSTLLRWGILGTGNIARQFCAGMAESERGIVAAVGSRDLATARAFAETYGIPAAFGSYEALIGAGEVDAVYLTLPNSLHCQWTIAALRAGKHVLCEKPIASSAAEAQAMFDAAEHAGRVLVEAFMYRSHPLTLAVEQAVRAGAIGELRLIRTSFCFRTLRLTGNIRFDRALAGGALMDVGCYCVNFSRFFAGAEPKIIQATGKMHESGVDELAAGIMLFPGAICASFACGMRVQADNTAQLCGSEGFIEIPIPWKPPPREAIWRIGRGAPPRMDAAGKLTPGPAPAPPPPQQFTVDSGKSLYALEADDFAATALDRQSPRISRLDSIGNMRVLDLLRQQVQGSA